MADAAYQSYNFLFESKGVTARYVDDALPPGTYLNLLNLEEIQEAGLATRLGSTLITKSGGATTPLPGLVHSLQKLAGLNGNAYRYAGSGTGLYRRSSLTPGAYTLVASGLSGQPWGSAVYQPSLSSFPLLFVADANRMLKDTGTQTLQSGIFQPQYPVLAQAQEPDLLTLDNYTAGEATYTYSGIGGGTNAVYVSTTTSSAVAATGVQSVNVAAPKQLGLFQLLTIDSGGNQEVVLAILLTTGGFVANFTKTHASGVPVTSAALSLSIPASTTATVSKSFGGTPIAAWPTVLSQSDYIGLYLYVSDPSQIQSITIKFDCGDGTFNSDYFYKVIGQGPLQQTLDTASSSTAAATDAVLASSLGIYSPGAGGISELNTGLNQWTALLNQLSDFAGAGRADFNDAVFNWNAVNGYQIQIVNNDNETIIVQFAALILFGGAGPDSFAGVSYDYLVTFYNANDGTESNPSMVMTDVNPPLQTNFVLPRRQPVALTLTFPTLDPQTTHLRIYRRGGTLASNYYRLDQVPVGTSPQKYLDILSDAQIQENDTVSFTNDVPVTSSLPVPVNTLLASAILTQNQVVRVYPNSMANISVRQQVNIGAVTATNFEVVIVLAVGPDYFSAFVQNTHAMGETVAATAAYGVPCSIMAVEFDQGWYANDPNNPSYLYYSAKGNVQAVSSAGYVNVGVPSFPITAIVGTNGNLFVSTLERWWSVAPGSNVGSSPTVYPTRVDHGCVGKLAWCLKDGVVYYLALDGIRTFVGGGGSYISEQIEFIWQGIGTTPIPIADPTQFSTAVFSWWNRFVFVAYTAVGGLRVRVILDVVNKRYRNDDVQASSMFLEEDTNTLVYGDNSGLIHIDRQNVAYDEGGQAGLVVQNPITITMQSPFNDQGQPQVQKNYAEFTLDANTNGQPVAATLLFNDGEFQQYLGTVTTTERAKVNLAVQDGDGVQAYKCSLQLVAPGTQRIFLFQAKIRAVMLAETRTSFDSYWMGLGIPDSKLLRLVYIEYNAGAPINFDVYYDGSATPLASASFTLPQFSGVRNTVWVILPAVKFRLIRFVATTTADCQIWPSSVYRWKSIRQSSGYQSAPLMS